MPQGHQPRTGSFEHRDALRTQLPGQVLVDRAAEVAQHGQRLVGPCGHIQHRQRIGLVPVQLMYEVDGQRDGRNGGVGGQGLQRAAEQVPGVGAGPPHIERIGRNEARIEQVSKPRYRRGANLRERNADSLGQVHDVRALQARVVHRRDARAAAAGRAPGRADPAPGREQLDGVGELAQIANPVHSVRSRQGFPAAVRARKGPRVGRDHLAAASRAAGGQEHHGNVSVCGARKHSPQARAVADGF